MDALLQKTHTLIQIGAKGPRGEESQRIIDHDRGFTYLLGEVKRLGQGEITGFFTHDDLNQRHLIDRREEVDANKVFRLGTRFGQSGNRQSGSVRAPYASISEVALELLGHLVLESDVFEYCLDNKVTARQVFVGGRWGNQRQH